MMNSLSQERKLRRCVFLFQVLALFLVMIYDADVLTSNRLYFAGLLVGLTYLANLVVRRFMKGEPFLFIIATFLLSIGTIMIFRLDDASGFKQIVWILAGFAMFFLSYFAMKVLRRLDRPVFLYFGLAVVLFLATAVLGVTINGARNWIIIGPISIQPTEISKILLIFFISSYYAQKERYENIAFRGKPIGQYLLLGCVYLLIALGVLQRDLGTVMIFAAVFLALQYMYEPNRKMILLNVGLMVAGGLMATLLFSHIRVRITTWINPWEHIDDIGYQITQSLFAVASGGFLGTGIGLGMPQTIPLAESDFIFAAICEEMGILTGMGLIMLFLLLVYRSYKIAFGQKSMFHRSLAIGLSTMFAAQSFIIFAGVLKVIPLTGITIPFVSYGGSSMLASFMALGILQYLSENKEKKGIAHGK